MRNAMCERGERETRGHERFALHKHKHQAMLGGCDQEQGVIKSPCSQVRVSKLSGPQLGVALRHMLGKSPTTYTLYLLLLLVYYSQA